MERLATMLGRSIKCSGVWVLQRRPRSIEVLRMVTTISSAAQFVDVVKKAPSAVLYFRAHWCAPCAQLDTLVNALSQKFPGVEFLSIEAEENPDVSELHSVSLVPTFVFMNAGQTVERFEGADVSAITMAVERLSKQSGRSVPAAAPTATTLKSRIETLLNRAPVMLFMKGSPAQPQCGFSRQMVDLLAQHNAVYDSFNILSDEEIRQGLKEYSNWPTYPQLYVAGKLVGGLDVVKELAEDGELEDILGANTKPSLEDRLKSLVSKEKVMLFMKGSPSEPRCGFSRQMVDLLNSKNAKFGSFDILSDEEVRQGLKTFSNWPTYPQLYLDGKLIGGLDVVKELAEDGELDDML